MKRVPLVFILFWLLVAILMTWVGANLYQGRPLLGIGEYFLVGILVLLAVGHEGRGLFSSLSRLELEQQEARQAQKVEKSVKGELQGDNSVD
jgi:hypothetical protein